MRAVDRYGPDLLRIPGVLAVRPGFRVVGGRLTREPAVVVTVAAKRPLEELAPHAALPANVDGVPVDVLQADPRDLEEEPPPRLDTWDWVFAPRALEAAPEIGYRSPTDVALDPAEVGRILCHVSPDAGWATLQPFLEGARERLTVAMYDFYATHIVDALAALGNARPDLRLELILQTDPSKEDEVIQRLRNAWQDRLDYTPAVVSGPRRVFANSYHTKVTVRDGEAFWLSSGNWSPTSQPLIPPGPQPTLYNRGNREWHVIIENAALARVFEAFIRHDIRQAREALAAGIPEFAPEPPDLLVPESALFFPEAAVEQPAPFDPQAFEGAFRVVPLMTPDNYTESVIALIENAQESLYLQYSYIRIPREIDGFRRLIDAVTAKIRDGLDVRIIVGRSQKTGDTQALQALGWSPAHFRYQSSKLHNKGILIDSRVTVVGSQNWSGDGTQYNRDASLEFDSPEIARYFRNVFLFDWDNLTREPSLPEVQPVIAEADRTPPGMVRIPWRAWFED